MDGGRRGTTDRMASPSCPSNRTLREQLAASPPHVSLKKALRALISTLRKASRGLEIPRHPLAGRAELERVLQSVVEAESNALETIKTHLRAVLNVPAEAERHAIAAADGLLALVPRVLSADASCAVRLENRPPQMDDRLARLLLGAEGSSMRAAEAALAMHRLHGLDVGGYKLEVHVTIPAGFCLPSVPRGERSDRGRWGREAPWLKHLDDLGRASLTPRRLAERMVDQAAGIGDRVLDVCGGCGGNTVAFAAAGRHVVAWELDAARAALARRNVHEHGVGARVTIHAGSVEDALARAVLPTDLLFVDPPWFPNGRDRADSFGDMFRTLPVLASVVERHKAVMLKLPRTFQVDTLPGGAAAWLLRYELGHRSTGDARVVRMITALRGVSPSAMASR